MRDVRIEASAGDVSTDALSPVFIVGAHRSGTSALYRILAESGAFAFFTAADIVALNAVRHGASAESELRRLDAVCAVLSTRIIDPTEITPDFPEEYGFLLPGRRLTPDTVEIFRKACAGIVAAQGMTRVLLKNPWDIDRLDFVTRSFPNARFVVIHRHPADVVSSQCNALRTLILDGSPYHDLIDPRSGTSRVPLIGRLTLRVPGAMSIFAAVLMVRLRFRLARLTEELTRIDPRRVVEIRFEDLAADQLTVLGKVHGFLGLDRPAEAKGFHAGRNHGQNRFRSRVARALLGDYARRHGY